jgi:hypothetical protein
MVSHDVYEDVANGRVAPRLLSRTIWRTIHRRVIRTSRTNRKRSHLRLRKSTPDIYPGPERVDEAFKHRFLGESDGESRICGALLHPLCVQLRFQAVVSDQVISQAIP